MSSTPPKHPEFIYKITTAEAFAGAEASGEFAGMPIDIADGFMHFSTAEQLGETLSLHFRGAAGLLLIAVGTEAVRSDLVWETSRGGQLFPHLYGPLPLSAVAWIEPVSVGIDGSCQLPAAVR